MALDFAFYQRMAYLDRALTRPVSCAIGRILLPWLGRRRLRHLRDAARDNIAIALGGGPHEVAARTQAERLARRMFSNFGAYIADYFLLPFLSERSLNRWVRGYAGAEHLDASLARGKGAILLTCHLGLWELGAIGLRRLGYDVNVVGFIDAAHPGVTEFRDWMRTRHGIGVINRDGVALAALAIRRLLEENRVVALLGDRLIGEKGVEVEFMGKRARFPVGPLRLARATGAAVHPSFVVREGRRYLATIEPPIDLEAHGQTEAGYQACAQAVARRFEHHIRAHMDQWYVFLPFWEPVIPPGSEQQNAA